MKFIFFCFPVRTDKRRANMKVDPTIILVISLMSITMGVMGEAVKTSSQEQQISRMQLTQGVILHTLGQFTLSGNKWQIIIEYDFAEFDNNIKKLNDVITKVTTEMDSYHERAFDYRRNYEKSFDYLHNEPVYLSNLIQGIFNIKGKMNAFLRTEVNELQTQIDEFRSTVLKSHERQAGRRKRGLIDVGGDIGKALFGIATTEDVEEITKKVRTLTQTTKEVLHLEKEQASVMKASIKEVKANRRTINELVRLAKVTTQEMVKMKQKLIDVSELSYNDMPTMALSIGTTQALQAEQDMVAMAIQKMRTDFNSLVNAIDTASSNRLSPYFLSSDKLQEVLNEIIARLPPNLGLAIHTDNNHLYDYYHEMSTVTIANDNSITIVVEVPLTERDRRFELIHAIPWPTPQGEDGLTVTLDVGQQYIAISEERQSFLELSEREARECMKGIRLCAPTSVIYSHPITSCLYSVVRGQDTNDMCRYTIMEIVQPQFRLISEVDTWLYYTKESVRMTITCIGEEPRDTFMKGAGTFYMPGNCSGYAPGIVMPQSFKANTLIHATQRKIRIPQIDLPTWNISQIKRMKGPREPDMLKQLKVHTLKEVKYLGQSVDQLQKDIDNEQELMTLRELINGLGKHSIGTWTVIGLVLLGLGITVTIFVYIKCNSKRQEPANEDNANETIEVPLVRVGTREKDGVPIVTPRVDKALRASVLAQIETLIGKDKRTHQRDAESTM